MAVLRQQLAEANARLAAAPAPAAAPAAAPTPAPAPAPAAEMPLYTAEETTALTAYRTEWKDVAAGEALARRAEYRQLVNFIHEQYRPIVEQVEALTVAQGTLSSRSQYTQLKDLVSDYDAVRDPALAWVDKQPPALKAAYQEVANNGKPEDIAALIDTFKKTTGWTAPAAAAPAASAPAAGMAAAPARAPAAAPAAAPVAAPAAALSAEAQAAVAALKPVSTARTEATAGTDPNDFDGAFKDALQVK